VGDKLILSMGCLIGVNKKTGEKVWEQENISEGYGTPVAFRIDGADAVVTPSGCIVAAEDGRILLEDMAHCQYSSPVVADNKVYFSGPGVECWQWTKLADGRLAGRRLWENADADGEIFASPVIEGGLIYVVNNDGKLFVLDDADNGKLVLSRQTELASPVYPSICSAGRHIFLFNSGGETVVIEPGKEYKEVNRNGLSAGSGGSAIFSGSRMYVRSGEYLICIGK
jgi:outer membrane protein assembly factor BamB